MTWNEPAFIASAAIAQETNNDIIKYILYKFVIVLFQCWKVLSISVEC